MDTSSKTSAYIGDTITYKNCIMHIKAQFITCLEQHTRARLATGASLIFIMRATVYFLYLASHFANTGHHPTMNLMDSFYRDGSTRHPRLVSTNDDAMASLR